MKNLAASSGGYSKQIIYNFTPQATENLTHGDNIMVKIKDYYSNNLYESP